MLWGGDVLFKKRFIIWAAISSVCLIIAAVCIIASAPIFSTISTENFEYQPLLRVRAKSTDFGVILYISNDDYNKLSSDTPDVVVFCNGQKYSGSAEIIGKVFLPQGMGITDGFIEGRCNIAGLAVKDSQQMECYIKLDPKLQCIGVPKSAVSLDEYGKYVYLIEDSSLIKTYISTDDSVVARLVSVTDGIKAGDVVVLNAAKVETIPKYMRRFASFD